MMGKRRTIDQVELERLIGLGLDRGQIARRLGVQPRSVTQAKKRFGLAPAEPRLPEEVEPDEQLRLINGYTKELLDLLVRWLRNEPEARERLEGLMVPGDGDGLKEASGTGASAAGRAGAGGARRKSAAVKVKRGAAFHPKDAGALMLKVLAEIREQIRLQMTIKTSDLDEFERFQGIILEEVKHVSPEIREKILLRLKELEN